MQPAGVRSVGKNGEKRQGRNGEVQVKVEGADGSETMEPPKKLRRPKMSRDDMCVPDDGYRWLQYGKKPLLDSRYSRFYYKCASKKDGCPAKKTVDCCQEDTEYMKVAYEGNHNHDIPPQTTRQVFIFRAANSSAGRPPAVVEVQTPPQSPQTASTEVTPVRHLSGAASMTFESGKNVAWTPAAMERVWSESMQQTSEKAGARGAAGAAVAGLGAETPSPVASPRPLGAAGRSWSFGCGTSGGARPAEIGGGTMPRLHSSAMLDQLEAGGGAASAGIGNLGAGGVATRGGCCLPPLDALSGLSAGYEDGPARGSPDGRTESQGSVHQHAMEAAAAGGFLGGCRPSFYEGAGLAVAQGGPPAGSGAVGPAAAQTAVYISYTNHVCLGPHNFYESPVPSASFPQPRGAPPPPPPPHMAPSYAAEAATQCHHFPGNGYSHVPSPLGQSMEHATGSGGGSTPEGLASFGPASFERMVSDFLVSPPPEVGGLPDYSMAPGGADAGHDFGAGGDHHGGAHAGGHADVGGDGFGDGAMDMSYFHDFDYGDLVGDFGGGGGDGGGFHDSAFSMFGMETTEGCDPLHEMQDHHFYGNEDFQPFGHLPGQYDPYWRGNGFHHR